MRRQVQECNPSAWRTIKGLLFTRPLRLSLHQGITWGWLRGKAGNRSWRRKPVAPIYRFLRRKRSMIEPAAEAVQQADIFVIIGTSLNVYPCCRSDFIYQASHSYLSDETGCRKYQWILQIEHISWRGFRWYEGTEGNIGKIKHSEYI